MPRVGAPAAGDVGEEHGAGGPPGEVERERDAGEPKPEPGDEEPADEDVDGRNRCSGKRKAKVPVSLGGVPV